jgi:hypothetical protein
MHNLNGKGECQQGSVKALLSVNHAIRKFTMADMMGKSFQRKDYWRAA